MKRIINYLSLLAMPLAICACSNGQNQKESTYFSFSFEGIGCTANFEEKYLKGTEVEITITPEKDYALPENIEFSGKTYTYSQDSGLLSFTIDEDTIVKCEAIYKTTYYITKDIFDGDVSYEWTVSKEDNKTTITRNNIYVCEEEYIYEDDKLVLYNQNYEEGYEPRNLHTDYKYSNNLLVEKNTYNDDDAHSLYEQTLYKYDQLNRLIETKEKYDGDEHTYLTTYSYPDEFTTIEVQCDFVDDVEVPYCQNETKIDTNNGTKTISKFYLVDCEEPYCTYVAVYDLDTDRLITETDHRERSVNVFEYNENGDPSLRIYYDINEETNEVTPFSKIEINYDENGILTSRDYSRYDDASQTYSLYEKYVYESNDKNIVIKETTYMVNEDGNLEQYCCDEYEYDSIDYKVDTTYLSLCVMPSNYTEDLFYR